jgi:hypothetical protein
MTQQHTFTFEPYIPALDEYLSYEVIIDIEAHWYPAEPDVGIATPWPELDSWDVSIDDEPIAGMDNPVTRKREYDTSAYPFTAAEFATAVDEALDDWCESASPED